MSSSWVAVWEPSCDASYPVFMVKATTDLGRARGRGKATNESAGEGEELRAKLEKAESENRRWDLISATVLGLAWI